MLFFEVVPGYLSHSQLMVKYNLGRILFGHHLGYYLESCLNNEIWMR